MASDPNFSGTNHPWDDPKRHEATRIKLLKDKIYELTLEDKYSKQEIANLVNRSISFIYHTWDKLCEECTCEHDFEQHKNLNCDHAENGVRCQCEKFDAKLRKNEYGHIIKSKPNRQVQTFEDIGKTNFIKFASIQKWRDSLIKSKVAKYKDMMSNFWRICATLDVNPDAFLMDITTVEELKDKFVQKYRDGEAVYLYDRKKRDSLQQSQANANPYIESIRSFRTRNGKEITKGYLEIDRENTDLYSMIHLNDVERKKTFHFMNNFGKIWGILFILQHELGVRIDTLFTMKPIWIKQFTQIDGNPCDYYKCIITEKKQDRPFEKLIITPEAIKIVQSLESNKRIHDFTNIREAKLQYNNYLRQAYANLEKISTLKENWKEYERKTDEWYYVNDPSHVIRHSAVHKLMRLSGERAEVVASMFWDAPKTLEIYRKMTIDSILMQGVCMICNKPNSDDPNERFCTLRHALLYYFRQREPKVETQ